MVATRTATRLPPDPTRVITKPFLPGEQVFPNGQSRVQTILGRLLGLAEAEVVETLSATLLAFDQRHRDLTEAFEHSFDEVAEHIDSPGELSTQRRLLIGAYFTHEYAVEAAALNNPSMVPAPDQTGLRADELRFVMSLRAIGEGHMSSIEFRTGVLDGEGQVKLDDPGPHLETGIRTPALYDKGFFTSRLMELGAMNDISGPILDALSDRFTIDEVRIAISQEMSRFADRSIAFETIRTLHWLASSNYSLDFDPMSSPSERVIFPASPTESRGMEDARFVQFTDDDGSMRYFATYTAFDGLNILPQLIETPDFVNFSIRTLGGIRARNKGIALFPRKVGGRFAALSRFDNENNHLMFSDNVRFWDDAEPLQVPKHPWELVQIGNCGSPVETEAGWLVITHGVGPMRQYSLGAILLDLDEPGRVIGHMEEPLLVPEEHERDGYVPNVVYSCGSLIHGDLLVLPYGYSDSVTSVATVPLYPLLDRLS